MIDDQIYPLINFTFLYQKFGKALKPLDSSSFDEGLASFGFAKKELNYELEVQAHWLSVILTDVFIDD